MGKIIIVSLNDKVLAAGQTIREEISLFYNLPKLLIS